MAILPITRPITGVEGALGATGVTGAVLPLFRVVELKKMCLGRQDVCVFTRKIKCRVSPQQTLTISRVDYVLPIHPTIPLNLAVWPRGIK
jgi:hypothetical protein